jgi:hypothetical protein
LYCPMRGERVYVQTVLNQSLHVVFKRCHYKAGDEALLRAEWLGQGSVEHADSDCLCSWSRMPLSEGAKRLRYDRARGAPNLVGAYPRRPGVAVVKRDPFVYSATEPSRESAPFVAVGKGSKHSIRPSTRVCASGAVRGGAVRASHGATGPIGWSAPRGVAWKTSNRFSPLEACDKREFPVLGAHVGKCRDVDAGRIVDVSDGHVGMCDSRGAGAQPRARLGYNSSGRRQPYGKGNLGKVGQSSTQLQRSEQPAGASSSPPRGDWRRGGGKAWASLARRAHGQQGVAHSCNVVRSPRTTLQAERTIAADKREDRHLNAAALL